MTKILQIWKLLFTKTFSHHDVQISNSFILVQYVMKQILLIFVFKRKIIQKLWLLLCIHPQFRAKKIISNECAISCKPGFVLIRKLCEISCKKVISWKNTKLLRKRIYCFVKTLFGEVVNNYIWRWENWRIWSG